MIKMEGIEYLFSKQQVSNEQVAVIKGNKRDIEERALLKGNAFEKTEKITIEMRKKYRKKIPKKKTVWGIGLDYV